MGKSAAGKTEVTDYRMSIHYGICHRADSLHGIYIGEKEAWSGTIVDQAPITIQRGDLFGGNKKEGGTVGTADWLPGHPSQGLGSFLAAKLGFSNALQAPGYRGISSCWFHGGGMGGFLWGSNNPYLRSIWFKVRRSPKVLAAHLRTINTGGTTVVTNGAIVTVGGVSQAVTNGVATAINGHTILRNTQSVTIDGTVVAAAYDSDAGYTIISVNGAEYPAPDSAVSIDGISVRVDGVTNFTVTIDGTVDANPAAIVYECLTNTDWGMGAPPSMINGGSFEVAATTLVGEMFGLSLQWAKSTDIESFVSEILDHIQATLFVNPRDGLLTLKLIRGDYDPDTLPVLTPDNCHITGFERKAWGETTNEISVTWTNPVNEQEETVVAQDLGNIMIQGAIITDNRNYYGVRSASLAMQLAQRDLASASAPLAIFQIEVDRSAWDFIPGGCAKLIYPEYGIDGVIVRLTQIDYGKAGSPTIKIDASEDIFSLAQSDYGDPDSTAWDNPARDPTPLDYMRIITAPSFFVSAALTAANVDALEYPETLAMFLTASSNDDEHRYELFGQRTEPNGDLFANSKGDKPLLGYTELAAGLPAEAVTVIPQFEETISGPGPRPGSFIFIGNTGEIAQEIALIQSFSDGIGWTLKRGVLDTVPRAWPAGTAMWFATIDTAAIDVNTIHTAFDTVTYKLLPYTSRGQLSFAAAPVVGAILTPRPHLPFRPANVTVAGVGYGTVNLSMSPPETVAVTWANRNRLTETSQVLGWSDPTTMGENGQTTTIRLLSTSGAVIANITGLTGTYYSLPISAFGNFGTADVRVLSVRDGLESLQGHTIRVRVRDGGYGDTYGENYGGTGASGSPGTPDPGVPGSGDPGGDLPPVNDFPNLPDKFY